MKINQSSIKLNEGLSLMVVGKGMEEGLREKGVMILSIDEEGVSKDGVTLKKLKKLWSLWLELLFSIQKKLKLYPQILTT